MTPGPGDLTRTRHQPPLTDNRHVVDVAPEPFEAMVGEALDGLPAELGRLMSNVAVTVQHEPGPRGLLGLYRGVLKGEGSIAKTTEENFGVTYGVGVQKDFTHNFGARLEWQAFPGAGGSTIPDSDIKIISVSGLWRFR